MATAQRVESTSVTLREHVPQSFALRAMVENHAHELAPLLPKGVELDQVVAELFMVCQKTPKLAQVAPAELIPAIGRALQTEGVIGHDVYLIPMENRKTGKVSVTLVIDYKYRMRMIVRAGGARAIDAYPVYAGETFSVKYGSAPRIEHEPRVDGDRGALLGAYAYAQIDRWTTKVLWMRLAEIEDIRKSSQSWGPSASKTCPAWYATKTVLNQIAKLLPQNPKLRLLQMQIEDEERGEFGEPVSPRATARVDGSDEPTPMDTASDDVTIEEADDEETAATPTGVTLEQALILVVKGEQLSTVRNAQLRALQTWALAKVESDGVSPSLLRMIGATRLILAAREAGSILEPPKKTKPVLAEKHDDPPGAFVEATRDGGSVYDGPPPRADELDLGDAVARQERNAIAMGL